MNLITVYNCWAIIEIILILRNRMQNSQHLIQIKGEKYPIKEKKQTFKV